ncbi:MAG: 1-acyl-sn-glycerol-3-phosphate acyltransferase [Flavobacteriaceae bacterium]|nr:1-acyl-sn-glycerol-3-phosphate acyltransferase [Flavobacteriaceae bacterium]
MIKYIWYHTVKLFLKIALHFYSKSIKISGKENIPRKGAVLFAVNHPNALLDPLYITTFNPRINHFLVRADVFKKPLVRKFLATLNLMPIYRIRDGRNKLSNNDEVFEKCYTILRKKQTLIIFPQGGHSRDRAIKPLSKGFTRIVFGTLEKYPELDVQVVPVGLTYQNSTQYPCKIAVNYGIPINSKQILTSNPKPKAIQVLKDEVSEQLKKLSVHIPENEHYNTVLQKLNQSNIDYTKVNEINENIKSNNFPKAKKTKKNYLKPLLYLIKLNSLLPYLFWKRNHKKIKDKEFVDTFRFGLNTFTFPIFYLLQGYLLSYFLEYSITVYYLIFSLTMVFLYTKLAPTPTED